LVTGMSIRKEEAIAFANEKNCWIKLEREKEDKYDSNAIKVIRCSKGSFKVKRRFIGYVPKETAKLIVEGNYLGIVLPRLSEKNFLEDQSSSHSEILSYQFHEPSVFHLDFNGFKIPIFTSNCPERLRAS
jgi:hypothetical protein